MVWQRCRVTRDANLHHAACSLSYGHHGRKTVQKISKDPRGTPSVRPVSVYICYNYIIRTRYQHRTCLTVSGVKFFEPPLALWPQATKFGLWPKLPCALKSAQLVSCCHPSFYCVCGDPHPFSPNYNPFPVPRHHRPASICVLWPPPNHHPSSRVTAAGMNARRQSVGGDG